MKLRDKTYYVSEGIVYSCRQSWMSEDNAGLDWVELLAADGDQALDIAEGWDLGVIDAAGLMNQ